MNPLWDLLAGAEVLLILYTRASVNVDFHVNLVGMFQTDKPVTANTTWNSKQAFGKDKKEISVHSWSERKIALHASPWADLMLHLSAFPYGAVLLTVKRAFIVCI